MLSNPPEPHRSICVLLLLAVSLATVTAPGARGSTVWTIEVVDDPAGDYPSIALASDGSPRVTYWVGPNILRYAWRDGTGWHNTTIDQDAPYWGGWGTSLVMDSAGDPHVSYGLAEGAGVQSVWYARWNATASGWDTEFVGPAGSTFTARVYTSLALNASGEPGIAYLRTDTDEMLFASRSGGTWTSEVVETPGWTESTPSVKFDSLDRPHVAYYDSTNLSLRYGVKESGNWILQTVDATAQAGYRLSLALDAADLPRIAYYWGIPPTEELRYAAWSGSAWNRTTVGCIGCGPHAAFSLALNATGAPRIAWPAGSVPAVLFYARWQGTSWDVETVDSDEVRFFASLALGAGDDAHIAYLVQGPDYRLLRYAHRTIVNDPPASALAVVAPYWHTAAPLALQATASDPDGTVQSVDLWYRFDGGGGWGAWSLFATDTVSPWVWNFPFPAGEGRYEFYTTAFDGTDTEVKTVAETSAGYDVTPPTSLALPVVPYFQPGPSVGVTATASDALSGVASVSLWSRYAWDNVSWEPWGSAGAVPGPPWTGSAPLDRLGYYEFRAQAVDAAGNVEPVKGPESRAAVTLLPPRHVATTWDGAWGVGLQWEPPPVPPDAYWIYRAADPMGFADLSAAGIYDSVPGSGTSWADADPLAAGEERYYLMRSESVNGTRRSATSNTAGVFTGILDAVVTAISRPLEYFPWVDYSGPERDTVGEFRTAFGADSVEYLEGGSWRSVPGTGNAAERLAVGRAYLVHRATPGTFVFTGLPGAMIAHAEGFGFDPAADARSLTAAVSGDDVLLAWTAPAGMGPGDAYEVWSSPTRAGFFDGDSVVEGAVVGATAFTDAGALASAAERYYWVVPVSASLGRGSPTYSIGVWTRTFAGADTLALPLRPDAARAVSGYADAVPGALGVLWLAGSDWIPHFAAMPAGVYDAPVVLGSGYQVSVRGTARYAFVGR